MTVIGIVLVAAVLDKGDDEEDDDDEEEEEEDVWSYLALSVGRVVELRLPLTVKSKDEGINLSPAGEGRGDVAWQLPFLSEAPPNCI